MNDPYSYLSGSETLSCQLLEQLPTVNDVRSRVEKFKVALGFRSDVGQVNGDVVVTIGSHLCMPEAQGVGELVSDCSDDLTTVSQRQILDSADHSHVGIATGSIEDTDSVGGSFALDKVNTGSGLDVLLGG